MSIDRVQLGSQYVQGNGTGINFAPSSIGRGPDFDNTLNTIISGNAGAEKQPRTGDFLNNNKTITTTNTELDEIFKKAAAAYNVPEELLKAVAKAESGFNPNAVSKCGAMGVMQLMPNTAKSLGVTDAFDAEQNIMGGASYLSQKLEAYDGDITLALAAYNAGSGNVAKYGGVPPFAETQNYIKKIFGYMGGDLELPEQILQTKSSMNGLLAQGMSDEESFSQMGTEKAFYTAQLQILKHQIDMQSLFAVGGSEDEEAEDFDINKMMDSLSRL